MLEIEPTTMFSNDYVLRTPDHALVELRLSSWRERGEFVLKGETHKLYRTGALSGDFVLERAGNIVARATKTSAFRDRFELYFNGVGFILQRSRAFSRRFIVVTNDREVGSIQPSRIWTGRAQVDLPAEWPVSVQLFVFWLVVVIWKRQTAAAAT